MVCNRTRWMYKRFICSENRKLDIEFGAISPINPMNPMLAKRKVVRSAIILLISK